MPVGPESNFPGEHDGEGPWDHGPWWADDDDGDDHDGPWGGNSWGDDGDDEGTTETIPGTLERRRGRRQSLGSGW